MPPAYLGHDKLRDDQIELIRKWIEQGAKYQPHWSFIPPIKRHCRRFKTRRGRRTMSITSCWTASKRKV